MKAAGSEFKVLLENKQMLSHINSNSAQPVVPSENAFWGVDCFPHF